MSHVLGLRGISELRRREQRGAAAVETVLIVPVVVLILSVMVAGWRIWDARTQVQASVDAAARAASMARSSSLAQSAADKVARANLSTGSVACDPLIITVDSAGFSVPVGQPADVSVSATCTVALADLLVPGLPGQLVISKTAIAPLDRHRHRGP